MIMAVSGAVLREVGTTNITRLSDCERALGPATGALLRVHASNYRIAGFTKSVPLEDLVALGRKHGLPVIDDVGSGALLDFGRSKAVDPGCRPGRPDRLSTRSLGSPLGPARSLPAHSLPPVHGRGWRRSGVGAAGEHR
jgi:L-seryl-tRNA(Ser) seleniumtransferase